MGKITVLCQVADAVKSLAGVYLFHEYTLCAGKFQIEFFHGRVNDPPAAKPVLLVQRGSLLQGTGHRHAAKSLQILQKARNDGAQRLPLVLHRDQLYMKRVAQQGRSVDKAGSQSPVAAGNAYVLNGGKGRIGGDLLQQLRRGFHISQRPPGGGRSIINDVRLAALVFQLCGQFLDCRRPLLFADAAEIDLLGAQDIIEQRVAFQLLRPGAVMNDHTFQPKAAAAGRAKRTQVGLRLPGDQNGFLPLRRRIPQQILQVADLVPADADAVQVVTLDEQRAAAQLILHPL